jgi:hypothetical protein
LKIKEALIQDSIVIHPDPGYTKADKSQENEAKTRKSRQRVNIKILCTGFFNNPYQWIKTK